MIIRNKSTILVLFVERVKKVFVIFLKSEDYPAKNLANTHILKEKISLN